MTTTTSPSLASAQRATRLLGEQARAPVGQRHDDQRRIGGALRGQHAAVDHEHVVNPPDAVRGVDHAVLGGEAHARAADEVGEAVDGEDVLGAGVLPDALHRPGGVRDVGAVVVAHRVRELRHRHSERVGLVGEGDAVVGLGEELAEDAEDAPVVVVAHVGAQGGAPVAVALHVLGPADGQRRDGLDGEPAGKAATLVGLVELLAGDLGGRRLVHAQVLGEAPGDLGGALDHDVAADLVVVVAQSVGEAAAGGVQEQARGLDRVAADGDGVSAHEVGGAVADVADAGGLSAALVGLDADRHRIGADLDAVLDRVGQMGDERAGLGVDLAALQAEAAIDAMGAVAEASVGDRHRPDAHLDAAVLGAAPGHRGGAGDGVGGMGVGVGIPPRPVLTGHRQLAFDALEGGLELLVGDRPVDGDAVPGAHLEVRGMQARDVAGEVGHRPADADTGVVLAHLHRVLAADDALVGPVDGAGALLVGDPVAVGIPERAALEDDDAPAGAGQPLGEGDAAGAGADDDEVDGVRRRVAAHPIEVAQAAAVGVKQPCRVVVAGHAGDALDEAAGPRAHRGGVSRSPVTGSRS